MTIRTLKLAPDLSLPLDAVSRTFGILAVRGAGKPSSLKAFGIHRPIFVRRPAAAVSA